MTELQELLAVRGFSEREAQNKLYEHLVSATHQGVIAQAGTGTGKSMGILAAAAHQARVTGTQSVIVTPTLTLMNQYRDGDTPWARKAFEDLAFAEVRGMSHYYCQQSVAFQAGIDIEHTGGCLGGDGECSQRGWEGHEDGCTPDCDVLHGPLWECGYRQARYEAKRADVVVTNADMLIVNDRVLANLPNPQNFLALDGSLYVDEAHTLEQKLRDYASRSLHWSSIERFKYADQVSVKALAGWLKRFDMNLAVKDIKVWDRQLPLLEQIAYATVPERDNGKRTTKQQETQEAAARMVAYLKDPHDHAVVHVSQGALKYDWINVAKSAGELLTQRRFGLVSATVPRTMGATLGVAEAPFTDVGHPFDYGQQAWIGFSSYGGDYRSAQGETNFNERVNEVRRLLERSKGGALVLFSSFRDLERVVEELSPWLSKEMGLKVLIQDRDMEAADRQALADEFKADGNAVLFGSESFATGFDVPGDALRLVVVWKLPYPAVDPVSNAIRSQSYQRYEDIMKVRAVQAVGRLIRTDEDKGIVWIADNRGRRLMDGNDPLTSHMPQFARL